MSKNRDAYTKFSDAGINPLQSFGAGLIGNGCGLFGQPYVKQKSRHGLL